MYLKSLFNIFGLILVLASCAVIDNQETTKEYMTDSSITLKVKGALADNANLKARQINVKTMKGAVQLSGFVESGDQIDLAGDVASNVKGVKKVHNNLIVKGSGSHKSATSAVKESASDASTTSKVKLALLRADNLKSTGIRVRTDNGAVILSGKVPTHDEASRAETIASDVEGVSSVQNQIRVTK